jgi:hypothetical protein
MLTNWLKTILISSYSYQAHILSDANGTIHNVTIYTHGLGNAGHDTGQLVEVKRLAWGGRTENALVVSRALLNGLHRRRVSNLTPKRANKKASAKMHPTVI